MQPKVSLLKDENSFALDTILADKYRITFQHHYWEVGKEQEEGTPRRFLRTITLVYNRRQLMEAIGTFEDFESAPEPPVQVPPEKDKVSKPKEEVKK